MERTCAYCMIKVTGNYVKLCRSCHRRAYCSRRCEKADWVPGLSSQVHSNWCSLDCGEEDLDWEVTAVPGKGLGVVAKRFIPARYRIMVDAARSHSHPGLQALEPLNGTTQDKINLNQLGAGERDSVICLRISRANHDCNANADHLYDPTFRVKILFAVRDIQMGEEICISYVPIRDCTVDLNGELIREALRTNWAINCPENCWCRRADIRAILERGRELDNLLLAAARVGNFNRALRAVDDQLAHHQIHSFSLVGMARTLNDGAQIAVKAGDTQRALKYLQRCHDIYANTIQSPNSAKTLICLDMLENLSSRQRRNRFRKFGELTNTQFVVILVIMVLLFLLASLPTLLRIFHLFGLW